MKLNRFLCVVLICTFVISLMPLCSFSAENIEFSVTDVKVRNGENGDFNTSSYLYESKYLDHGTGVFSDRDYRFSNIPAEFVGCGYIRTGKNDISNEYYINPEVTDWLTFKINKSATIYIVDYFRLNVTPASWLVSQEWSSYETTDVKFKTAMDSDEEVTSKRIFYKHFDVEDGETKIINLGGYDVTPYNNYSVFIKPDDLVKYSDYRFNEYELASPSWETDILNSLGNSLVMACGSGKYYLNSVRGSIDSTCSITPYKSENDVYIPLVFTAEILGGSVECKGEIATLSYNSKTYTLNNNSNIVSSGNESFALAAPIIFGDGTIYASSDVAEKIFSFNLTLSDDGAIIIKNSNTAIEKNITEKTEALFLVNPADITIRSKYLKDNDEIVVRDGEYHNSAFYLNFNGSSLNIKPQTAGKVKFKGDCHFELSGTNITIKDFYFEEARTHGKNLFTLKGFSNGRITGCYFYKCGSKSNSGYPMIYVSEKSQYNRFDHNTFERNQSMGIAITQQDDCPENLQNTHNTIDHNYVVDIRSVQEEWGTSGSMEAFQVGIGNRFQPLNTTVEYNLVENCIGDGNEIIGNKSSYNTYRNNTFLNNRNAHWQIRTGDNVTIDGNYFINNQTGLVIYGKGHIITNNYFYNSQRESLKLPTGNFREKTYYYKEASENLIANNTFVGFNVNGISLGGSYDGLSEKYTYYPKDNTFINNLFVMDRGKGIADYGSHNSVYENNLAVINGASALGIPEKGFKTVYQDRKFDLSMGFGKINIQTNNPKIELEYINGVYVPKDSVYINSAGKSDDRIPGNVCDVGVNNARERAMNEGPLNVDKVGPQNRWWVSEMRYTPCKDFDSKGQGIVTGYTPSVRSVYLSVGQSYDLHALAGKATYADSESYYIPLTDIKYEITEGQNILKCDGRYIYPVSSGSAKIKATYKGYSSYISVKAVGEIEEYTMNFDSANESMINLSGRYQISNGKLVFASPGISVSDKSYLKGNYSVSFDVKINDIGKTGVYKTDARIIFGYRMNPKAEYYTSGFGGKDFYRNGIYKDDGTYLPNRIADSNVFVEDGKNYRGELRVYGKTAVLLIDDEIAQVYEADENIEGMIGFGSLMNGAEFDNVVVRKIVAPESIVKKKLNISAEQTDVYEATLNFSKFDNVIYRVYRNGLWLCDTTNNSLTDGTLESGNTFVYKIRAIDKEGRIFAEESYTFERSKTPPETLFYISDVAYRTGINGEFEYGIYHGFNKGLNSKTWVFHDYNYTYTDLPSEFMDAAYIQVPNSYRTHTVATDPATNDWLRFTLNNQSADVYLIFHMNPGVAYPSWLSENNWIPVDYTFTHQDGTITSTAVYKKSFEIENGESKIVSVGGFGCTPLRTYSIIIKRR